MNALPDMQARTSILQYYLVALLSLLALSGLLDLFLGEAERPINIHHIIAALGLLALFARGRFVLPAPSINLFFIALLLISIVAALQHGVHAMLLNSAYCYYLCLLGLLCATSLTRAELIKALRLSAWIVLGAIAVKNMFYMHDIMDALSAFQERVYIPTVVAGGINIEASFALFAAVFLRGSRGYWPAFGYAFFLAIVYSSRAAILGCGLLFAYELIAPASGAARLFGRFRIAGLILAGLVISASLFSAPIIQFALSRFENIGYEPGSEGRLSMWQAAADVFLHNPLGVGAGNSIHEIEKVLAHDIMEDNVHNIYLQILVDLGIFGFGAYAVMILAATRRGIQMREVNPLWLAIGLYFFMGALQFRAYDPFFFFWLGLAWHDAQSEAAA